MPQDAPVASAAGPKAAAKAAKAAKAGEPPLPRQRGRPSKAALAAREAAAEEADKRSARAEEADERSAQAGGGGGGRSSDDGDSDDGRVGNARYGGGRGGGGRGGGQGQGQGGQGQGGQGQGGEAGFEALIRGARAEAAARATAANQADEEWRSAKAAAEEADAAAAEAEEAAHDLTAEARGAAAVKAANLVAFSALNDEGEANPENEAAMRVAEGLYLSVINAADAAEARARAAREAAPGVREAAERAMVEARAAMAAASAAKRTWYEKCGGPPLRSGHAAAAVIADSILKGRPVYRAELPPILPAPAGGPPVTPLTAASVADYMKGARPPTVWPARRPGKSVYSFGQEDITHLFNDPDCWRVFSSHMPAPAETQDITPAAAEAVVRMIWCNPKVPLNHSMTVHEDNIFSLVRLPELPDPSPEDFGAIIASKACAAARLMQYHRQGGVGAEAIEAAIRSLSF